MEVNLVQRVRRVDSLQHEYDVDDGRVFLELGYKSDYCRKQGLSRLRNERVFIINSREGRG